jgi:hypothetical protein
VRGPSRAVVRAARTRVELCVDSALSTAGWQILPYTHFVSIPLASAHAEAVLTRFKAAALAADGGSAAAAAGIDETMFWEPKQLHLTLCMLKLYSAQARLLLLRLPTPTLDTRSSCPCIVRSIQAAIDGS